MSRAGKRKDRVALDAYITPDPVASLCVAQLPRSQVLRPVILEPSVGGGAFARAARAHFGTCHITGVDLDPAPFGMVDCDFFIHSDWMHALIPERPDWIIGNPPYKHAEEHIRQAFRFQATAGCAFLLRLGFLATAKRHDFWREFAPTEVCVLQDRPSFTGDGKTDGSEYAFFIWSGTPGPGWDGVTLRIIN